MQLCTYVGCYRIMLTVFLYFGVNIVKMLPICHEAMDNYQTSPLVMELWTLMRCKTMLIFQEFLVIHMQ